MTNRNTIHINNISLIDYQPICTLIPCTRSQNNIPKDINIIFINIINIIRSLQPFIWTTYINIFLKPYTLRATGNITCCHLTFCRSTLKNSTFFYGTSRLCISSGSGLFKFIKIPFQYHLLQGCNINSRFITRQSSTNHIFS